MTALRTLPPCVVLISPLNTSRLVISRCQQKWEKFAVGTTSNRSTPSTGCAISASLSVGALVRTVACLDRHPCGPGRASFKESQRPSPGEGGCLLVEGIAPVAFEKPVGGAGIFMISHVPARDVHARFEFFHACSGHPCIVLCKMKQKSRPAPGVVAVPCRVEHNGRAYWQLRPLGEPKRPMPAHRKTDDCDPRACHGFVARELVNRKGQLLVGRCSASGCRLGSEAPCCNFRCRYLSGVEIRCERDVAGLRKAIAQLPEKCIEAPPRVEDNDARTGTALRYCKVMWRHVHED